MVNQGGIEGRLDADFYLPDFLRLEKQVKTKTSKTLNNYILSMAGGATPLKENKEYYTEDKENGIPFLRVQNLSTDSTLILEDCKYITEAVHETMLKRSQVTDQDLLVKITGVGRMAIASVPPEGFVGNTNQHMVVIKTGSRKTSLQLAYWLNTDIAEKLATRRAGGGTRPALDYEALKSIPVIDETHIVELMQTAHATKQSKEAEATALRQSIDGYVLEQLGITLPTVEKRLCFGVSSLQIIGSRLDSRFYKKMFLTFLQMLEKSTNSKPLGILATYIGSGSTPTAGGDAYTEDINKGVPFIRVTNLKNNTISLEDTLYIKREIHEGILKRTQLKSNDVLLSMAGTIGLSVVVPDWLDEANINQALARIVLKDSVNPWYVSVILNSEIGRIQTDRLSRPSVQSNLNLEEIGDIQIPLPPRPLQDAIAEAVQARLARAKQLDSEASHALASAKADVERLLFGEV